MKDDCFKLKAKYSPKGDQPDAINSLLNGLESGLHKHYSKMSEIGQKSVKKIAESNF